MAEKDRLRTKCIRVKLTEAEHEYFLAKAKSAGCSMSDFVRRIIKEGLIVKLETFDIRGMSIELNRIGTNLNQIARHINEKGGEYDKQDMANLIEVFSEMTSYVYGKALGMDEGVKRYLDDVVRAYGTEYLVEYLDSLNSETVE